MIGKALALVVGLLGGGVSGLVGPEVILPHPNQANPVLVSPVECVPVTHDGHQPNGKPVVKQRVPLGYSEDAVKLRRQVNHIPGATVPSRSSSQFRKGWRGFCEKNIDPRAHVVCGRLPRVGNSYPGRHGLIDEISRIVRARLGLGDGQIRPQLSPSGSYRNPDLPASYERQENREDRYRIGEEAAPPRFPSAWTLSFALLACAIGLMVGGFRCRNEDVGGAVFVAGCGVSGLALVSLRWLFV